MHFNIEREKPYKLSPKMVPDLGALAAQAAFLSAMGERPSPKIDLLLPNSLSRKLEQDNCEASHKWVYFPHEGVKSVAISVFMLPKLITIEGMAATIQGWFLATSGVRFTPPYPVNEEVKEYISALKFENMVPGNEWDNLADIHYDYEKQDGTITFQ